MTYTFPSYVPAIAVGVGVVAALIGVVLVWRQSSPRLYAVAFGVAAIACFLFAPNMAMDRVVLDDEKLEQTTGFWFSPTVKGFHFAAVDNVTITTARDRKNREHEVWIVTFNSGATQQIDPGDLWEMHSADIVRRLREKGIDVRP